MTEDRPCNGSLTWTATGRPALWRRLRNSSKDGSCPILTAHRAHGEYETREPNSPYARHYLITVVTGVTKGILHLSQQGDLAPPEGAGRADGEEAGVARGGERHSTQKEQHVQRP